MRTSLLLPIAACLLTALLLPAFAAAQPVSCQADVPCKALMERAAERSKSGNLPEALRLYKLAFESQPDPRLYYNIARTLHKLEQLTEAAPYYQKFLDSDIKDETQRARAREYLDQIGPVSAPAPSHRLDPTGAQPEVHLQPDARPQPDGPSQPDSRPIYKKWWFWTLTGAAVAGIALGVGLGVGLGNRVSVPDDRMVYTPTF